jgi:hypothetical protein
MRFRDGSDKETASVHQVLCKYRKKCDGDPGMIRQVFEEESMSRTWVFEWHALFRTSQTSIENDHTLVGPSAAQCVTLLSNLNS